MPARCCPGTGECRGVCPHPQQSCAAGANLFGTRMVLRAQCPHCAQGGREVERRPSFKKMTVALAGSGTCLFIFLTNVLERVQTLLLPQHGPGMQAETPAEQLLLPQEGPCQPARPPTPTCSPGDEVMLIFFRRKILPGPAPPVACGFPHVHPTVLRQSFSLTREGVPVV